MPFGPWATITLGCPILALFARVGTTNLYSVGFILQVQIGSSTEGFQRLVPGSIVPTLDQERQGWGSLFQGNAKMGQPPPSQPTSIGDERT